MAYMALTLSLSLFLNIAILLIVVTAILKGLHVQYIYFL